MLWNTLHLQSARALRPCLRPPLSTRFVPCVPHHGLSRTARFLSDKSRTSTFPSFREELARTSEVESFSEKIRRPSIRNQVFFFLAGSGIAFSYAATKTNIDTEHWSKAISTMSNVWSNRKPTSDEMRRTQKFELGAKLQNFVEELKEMTTNFPIAVRNVIFITYVNLANPYLNASEGRRLCWKICFLNTAIWVAWQVPRLQRFMHHAFMHHPLSGLSYTLLTSMFSHKSFMHLLFNSFALCSFGAAATNYLIREQYQSVSGLQESTTTWHFLAFFISAGLFSGLVSHIASTRIIFPRVISQLSASSSGAAATATASAATVTAAKSASKSSSLIRPVMDILPSLGASGAIYAAASLTALGFPDSEFGLLFLPTYGIPSQWGMGGIVLMDIIGIMRGWRYFDHYAHLGGAAFGAFYYLYGPAWWDYMRVRLSPPSKVTPK
ncbi:hypothetical protein PILCRDRAFT_813998 [Piloderma croceum F 1598]|uniref:Peptidase S54 rhomboid domain-containing protein n=1 Tax=Piloderma croceum (strain F 1598) TaxID=765440 RepID=A0A0C3G8P6_PILCF|nr:hypothetical protein PILCRDRAFT_813998 [Piloderma croceum F 1598]